MHLIHDDISFALSQVCNPPFLHDKPDGDAAPFQEPRKAIDMDIRRKRAHGEKREGGSPSFQSSQGCDSIAERASNLTPLPSPFPPRRASGGDPGVPLPPTLRSSGCKREEMHPSRGLSYCKTKCWRAGFDLPDRRSLSPFRRPQPPPPLPYMTAGTCSLQGRKKESRRKERGIAKIDVLIPAGMRPSPPSPPPPPDGAGEQRVIVISPGAHASRLQGKRVDTINAPFWEKVFFFITHLRP
ncbi:hypothetical protein LZ32DRAFT_310171 [Colletotrichum eremochloae]|nr:hypothetical protein LZ32DRAFT_310171 [Colletotrichum eremochloae]